MKLTLPANISRLRKEHAMTQEQLAEALGVTFAAVSKWERGVATPELPLLGEMADLFAVSLDALVGYQFQNQDRQTVIARLKQYAHERTGDDVFSFMEKALRRYPNCFDVVYYSGRIYSVRGFTQGSTPYLNRALALYSHACLLIGENTDPEVSETSLRKEMASLYLALGAYDKGIALLKQNNPCRMNHPLIGQTLASSCNDPEGALPYLSMALLDLTVNHTQIVMGYLNVFCKTNDYANALALVQWALAFYPGLRKGEIPGYLDKAEGVLWAVQGSILLSLGRREAALESLRQAKTIALGFDAAPNYQATSIRFVSGQTPGTAFDDLGDSALAGVEAFIAGEENGELSALWERVKTVG